MIGQRMIYQIGDVVLHGHHRSGQTQNYQARGASVELVDTYRVLTSVSPHKTSIRRETSDILLFSNGVFGASQIAELLKRQVGVFTDIISYTNITREVPLAHDCGCAICGCCPCNILWLHNAGVLKSINVTPVDINIYSATLEFELHTYWKPLNRLLWTKRGLGLSRNFNQYSFNDSLDEKVLQYPTCDTFNTGCIQFYKQHYQNLNNFIYDPYWQLELLCQSLPNSYPMIGSATYWGVGNSTKMVHENQMYWSAPPLSIYTFRKVQNKDGLVEILINREEANRAIDSVTTINLERVNNLADNNGVTLIASDELRVGDVDGFAHIMRDGEIILYCAEAVNRSEGDFPGYLSPGTNRIQIDPQNTEYWQYHLFRSL